MAPARTQPRVARTEPGPAQGDGSNPKRSRILEAARRVCAQTGYEAATMDAVAAEAHVSKGTLYNFFESKERLFLSTVLQAYDEAEATLQAHASASDEPAARLAGLVEGLLAGFPQVADGMLVNLQVWALVLGDADARDRMFADLRDRYGRLHRDLCETLRAGQGAGAFRAALDPEVVAQSLSSLYDGFVYRSVFDPERADAGALRAALEGLIRDTVLPPVGREAR